MKLIAISVTTSSRALPQLGGLDQGELNLHAALAVDLLLDDAADLAIDAIEQRGEGIDAAAMLEDIPGTHQPAVARHFRITWKVPHDPDAAGRKSHCFFLGLVLDLTVTVQLARRPNAGQCGASITEARRHEKSRGHGNRWRTKCREQIKPNYIQIYL
jgi:hypothetical protein